MKIVVLLSTYNGEKYIKTQLDSILHQTVPVQVLIRDDGSKDKTLEIIQEYINNGSDIELIRGENVGVKASFLELIKMAPNADYYAFADQDDFWLEKKIESAIYKLTEEDGEKPLLYCSNTYLVDNELQIIQKEDRNPRPSFGNALVENICTGCTAVINRNLLEVVRANIPDANQIVMHDWWLYLLAEAYGKTVFDNEPQIYYRQHGNNQWGIKTTKWQILKYRVGQLFVSRGENYRQLQEFEKCVGKQKKYTFESSFDELLQKVLASKNSFTARWKLFFDKRIYRNDVNRDRVYRLAVLIGKF